MFRFNFVKRDIPIVSIILNISNSFFHTYEYNSLQKVVSKKTWRMLYTMTYDRYRLSWNQQKSHLIPHTNHSGSLAQSRNSAEHSRKT